jgi:hypothetical protein
MKERATSKKDVKIADVTRIITANGVRKLTGLQCHRQSLLLQKQQQPRFLKFVTPTLTRSAGVWTTQNTGKVPTAVNASKPRQTEIYACAISLICAFKRQLLLRNSWQSKVLLHQTKETWTVRQEDRAGILTVVTSNKAHTFV